MKRVVSYLLGVLACASAAVGLAPRPAVSEVGELPLSADYCAIYFALTGLVERNCDPPVALGAPRTVASKPNLSAAPLDTPDGPRGYFIRFAFNSSDIPAEYASHLERLSAAFQTPKLEKTCVKLVGHTDTVGSDSFNLNLSQQRANSVRQHMIAAGQISAERIAAEGVGESFPVPSVRGDHQVNRRVEILVKEQIEGKC